MTQLVFRGALALILLMPALTASPETITIYRDEFGIPHIYAETAEGGLYAQGYAMAADGLERTLENYLRGLGRFSRAFGPGENDVNIRADLESLMWDHYGAAKKHYRTLPEAFRSHNAAFVEGINAYMKKHPGDMLVVPEVYVGKACGCEAANMDVPGVYANFPIAEAAVPAQVGIDN